ncbi:hypothetical protein PHMEG_00014516 [Phytophthora megakarya]|uniref:Uncharacterized protein n=1 Tax=Phytophthora megakarya TaxID=4795 RepID=A0A225W3L1_9STRA|nr:hypothetical protein PHMEG_00014516 [Phytophthora megakarya]
MASDEGSSADIENIDTLNTLDGLQAQHRQTQAGVCRWKDCKKVDKRDEGVVHQECAVLNTDAAARSSDTEVEEDSSSDEGSKNGEETAERRTHAVAKKNELQEQELSLRRRQIDNDSRAAEARISESNAHASTFREEAEHWRLQR